jgi:hypothetical protein
MVPAAAADSLFPVVRLPDSAYRYLVSGELELPSGVDGFLDQTHAFHDERVSLTAFPGASHQGADKFQLGIL